MHFMMPLTVFVMQREQRANSSRGNCCHEAGKGCYSQSGDICFRTVFSNVTAL